MSSSSSNSESSDIFDDSDVLYYSDYEIEVEPSEDDVSGDEQHMYQIERELTSNSSDEESTQCADDPVADAEWTSQYEEEMQEIRAQKQRLKDRLDGNVDLSEW